MIRIALVDDHPALRAGLSTVLEAATDLVSVGSAESEMDLWPMLKTTEPDVLLLDYHLPGSDGLQVCRKVKARPLAPRVLLYSAYAGAQLAIPAALAQADGVVGKGMPARELFEAIRTVAAGDRVMPPVPAALREEAARRLAPSDVPIMGMMLEGTPPADVADVLGMDAAELDHRVEAMLERLRVDVPAPPR